MRTTHVAALAITAFALITLGLAAGSLDAARPDGPAVAESADGSVAPREQSGPSRQPDRPDRPSVGRLVLPDDGVLGSLGEQSSPAGGLRSRLAVGGALVVGAVVLVFRRLTDDDARAAETTEERGGADHKPSERNAPAPSDWGGPPANGISRAWFAMVSALGAAATPRQTPAELARTAADAGLPAGTVESLTELFRAVRYGGKRPTDERERRAEDALDALRRDENWPDGREP
ncbi:MULTISPECIES: DUF4129 domain-containing protein [Haloferax]|uniref:Protein-glutamine gamma-glutamyltransferase-like C-terminal domain-containing protein n=2 Tax=Haloferax gibbonsii TaxID=35746 RepID=A0A0K1IYT7_HALGI|nr:MULTISPECIES: DUF4129 domain-containing protein [Haloferax]AKU09609.1 hypothetical protein ABY42_17535 [Haloferax gibbonsii]ELZ75895.1 hypothetical protein C454_19614 [Haloferax gibbonsii ATCC 33959]RDZ50703.1 DUF4129 domain-containing protein [Haloferax sp. Atlit-4N]REA01629.1 DUF4129 domain-containing protein [Haloferax sp. Atlit-6N]